MEEGSDRFAYEKRAPWLSVIGWSVAQIILGDGLLSIRFPLGMVLGSILCKATRLGFAR